MPDERRQWDFRRGKADAWVVNNISEWKELKPNLWRKKAIKSKAICTTELWESLRNWTESRTVGWGLRKGDGGTFVYRILTTSDGSVLFPSHWVNPAPESYAYMQTPTSSTHALEDRAWAKDLCVSRSSRNMIPRSRSKGTAEVKSETARVIIILARTMSD